MRTELERLRLIEEQLLNGPAALSAEDWQLRHLLDGELAADTDAQQRLYQGLRLAGRRQLRRELRTIHERLYGLPTNPWARLWQQLKPW
ncbi:hypothetical protein [Hymenobacter convexus]|uniref:hypothetical protein n=1 Tax=Hymenobacter sp. CA1UV-4 TaxID=3063782 RepID=UPI0027137EAD|nr:hypothetical protein [Hymenobacter sp. CA1UV-4]MDO7850908.1 hypothetical protein [Hymenobacter sp. CA1UV-4]